MIIIFSLAALKKKILDSKNDMAYHPCLYRVRSKTAMDFMNGVKNERDIDC